MAEMLTVTIMILRTYKELSKLKTFKERYEYLRLAAIVGETTFGVDRYLNQAFYKSSEWRKAKQAVIIRDNGCDLGVEGFEIAGPIYVHHMNPITIEDIEYRNPDIWNPDFLISTSFDTHNAIHFGDENLLPPMLIERYPGDTKMW